MKEKLNIMIRLLNKELRLFLGISHGVFLFVLFFQPFPLEHLDFETRLLFVTGLGVIVFMLSFLVRIVYPCLMKKNAQSEKETALHSFISGLIIWILSSVAFIFYLNYTGFVRLTTYHIFKAILICLAPFVILTLSDRMAELRRQNQSLASKRNNVTPPNV